MPANRPSTNSAEGDLLACEIARFRPSGPTIPALEPAGYKGPEPSDGVAPSRNSARMMCTPESTPCLQHAQPSTSNAVPGSLAPQKFSMSQEEARQYESNTILRIQTMASHIQTMFNQHHQTGKRLEDENQALRSEGQRLRDVKQRLSNETQWLRDQLNQSCEHVDRLRKITLDQEAKLQSLDTEKQNLNEEAVRSAQLLEESRTCSVGLREQLEKESKQAEGLGRKFRELVVTKTQEDQRQNDLMATEARLKKEIETELQQERERTQNISSAALQLQKMLAQQKLMNSGLTAAGRSMAAAGQSQEFSLEAKREITKTLAAKVTKAREVQRLAIAGLHDANKEIEKLKLRLEKQHEEHMAKESVISVRIDSMQRTAEEQRKALHNEKEAHGRALTALAASQDQHNIAIDAIRSSYDSLNAKFIDTESRLGAELQASQALQRDLDKEKARARKCLEDALAEAETVAKYTRELIYERDQAKNEVVELKRKIDVLQDDLTWYSSRLDEVQEMNEDLQADMNNMYKEKLIPITRAKDEEIRAKDEVIRVRDEELREKEDVVVTLTAMVEKQLAAYMRVLKGETTSNGATIEDQIAEKQLAGYMRVMQRAKTMSSGVAKDEQGVGAKKRKAASHEALIDEQDEDSDCLTVAPRSPTVERSTPKRRRTVNGTAVPRSPLVKLECCAVTGESTV